MSVPILRIQFSAEDREYIAAGMADILDSGNLTMGKYTREFEERFCGLTGVRYAVATSNCTTALEIILRGLGVRRQSVIVPTNTFLATALAVMHSGNRVIFADSDPDTLCLDAADVESRIADDTAAIVLVHIGGVVSSAARDLRELCDRRRLYLIEDCAHAHGCTLDGVQAGAIGVAGAFSFFPTKVLVTGEGGMLTTNDEGLYREALKFRNHGKDVALKNSMSALGHNYRLSEPTALMGVQQMRKAPEIFAERRRVAARYDARLSNSAFVRPLVLSQGASSTYYKYVAFLNPAFDRASVKAQMKERFGVSLTGEVYADLCHTEPIWQSVTPCGEAIDTRGVHRWPGCPCTAAFGEFPGAGHLSRHHICLPLYPGLSDAEIDHVVSSLEQVLHEEARVVAAV